MLRAQFGMGSNQTRTLGLAVGALVAFGALMVWVLTSSSRAGSSEAPAVAASPAPEVATESPTRPVPVAATGQTALAAQPTPAAQPRPAADLFAGAMPDFMADAHARVLDKQWLDSAVQKQLYDHGQAHKDDARPQLLLAWDAMNREWDGIAVRMYRIAYRADGRAKDDPSMLRDLLDVASRFDRTENREATELVKEAYGREALPQLDAALAELREQGDLVRAARLQRVRSAITDR
jgi:hypothetical protein